MAITLSFQGIEVTCDEPEEAMVLAGAAAAAVKLPKPADLAKLMERPVKLKLSNGVELTCETPFAAAATLLSAGIVKKPKSSTTESRGAQGAGPQKAWQQAEEYGEKYGMAKDLAHKLIAQKKREIKARLALGSLTPDDKKFMDQLKALPSSGEDMEDKAKKKKK
jgi:hypothetical protein